MSVFYLKVNRDVDYSYVCVQFWIDVARAKNGKIYIICDNDTVEKNIIERCKTDNTIQFIKSMSEEVEYISVDIANKRWKKAADAHLTCFFHAQENGIHKFWNIDADDTIFCTSPGKTADILSDVEVVANARNIKAFSLDMWWTIHKGNNWTFGVTYTDLDGADWIHKIELHQKDAAYKQLENSDENIDSYINYLRNMKEVSAETFYVQNIDFIHWGAPFGPLHYKFKDEYIYFPFKFTYLFTGTLKNGKCRIPNEVLKICTEIEDQEKKPFKTRRYLTRISKSYNTPPFIFMINRMGWNGIFRKICERLKNNEGKSG